MREIKKGSIVRVLRRDIFPFRNWKKKRPHGKVMRIDGWNYYVKFNSLPRNTPAMQLYEKEIELI